MIDMQHVTILIMDDAHLIRQLIVELLADIANVRRIIEATDARSAMQMFVEYHPQIAILDIQVPGDKNGMDVLKHLKRDAWAPAVIMLTNHATSSYRRACEQAGADYFFDKSTEFEQITAAVTTLIQRSL